jgi:hypothetical protein
MVVALKYEGIGAIQGGFELFGKVAMQSLTADPEVDKAMSGLDRFLDESKFEALAKEAGMAPPKENKPK